LHLSGRLAAKPIGSDRTDLHLSHNPQKVASQDLMVNVIEQQGQMRIHLSLSIEVRIVMDPHDTALPGDGLQLGICQVPGMWPQGVAIGVGDDHRRLA
jgi:hypothetical protein